MGQSTHAAVPPSSRRVGIGVLAATLALVLAGVAAAEPHATARIVVDPGAPRLTVEASDHRRGDMPTAILFVGRGAVHMVIEPSDSTWPFPEDVFFLKYLPGIAGSVSTPMTVGLRGAGAIADASVARFGPNKLGPARAIPSGPGAFTIPRLAPDQYVLHVVVQFGPGTVAFEAALRAA